MDWPKILTMIYEITSTGKPFPSSKKFLIAKLTFQEHFCKSSVKPDNFLFLFASLKLSKHFQWLLAPIPSHPQLSEHLLSVLPIPSTFSIFFPPEYISYPQLDVEALWAGIMSYTKLCLPRFVEDYLTCYRFHQYLLNLFLNGVLSDAEEHTQFIFSMTQQGRTFLSVPDHLCSLSPLQNNGKAF